MALVVADSALGGGSLASAAVDGVRAGWRGQIVRDAAVAAAAVRSFLAHGAGPNAWSATAAADNGPSAEFASALLTDRRIPAESTGQLAATRIGPVEFGATAPGPPVPVEWRVAPLLGFLFGVPVEFGATSQGAHLPLAWRASQHRDPGLPIGAAGTLSADRLLPAEWLQQPHVSRLVETPLEWGSRHQGAHLPLAWRAILRGGQPSWLSIGKVSRSELPDLPLSWTQHQTLVIDRLLPVEITGRLDVDTSPLLLDLLTRLAHAFAAAEWTRLSAAGRELILETARNANSVVLDRGLPVELLAPMLADLSPMLGMLFPARADSGVPTAARGDLAVQIAVLAAETSGNLALTRMLPAEALIAAIADGHLPLSPRRAERRDAPAAAEWHSIATIADRLLPAEFISPAISAVSLLPLAARRQLARVAFVPADWVSPISARSFLALASGTDLLLLRTLPTAAGAAMRLFAAIPTDFARLVRGEHEVHAAWLLSERRDHPVAAALRSLVPGVGRVGGENRGNIVLVRSIPAETLRAALARTAAPLVSLASRRRSSTLAAAASAGLFRLVEIRSEDGGILVALVPGPSLATRALFDARVASVPVDFLGRVPPHASSFDQFVAIGWNALLPAPLVAIDGDKLLRSPGLVRILRARRWW